MRLTIEKYGSISFGCKHNKQHTISPEPQILSCGCVITEQDIKHGYNLLLYNKLKYSARSANQRAARHYNQTDRVTAEQLKNLLPATKCIRCNKPFDHELNWSLDHIVPFNKGGRNVITNIGFAHSICNSRFQ